MRGCATWRNRFSRGEIQRSVPEVTDLLCFSNWIYRLWKHASLSISLSLSLAPFVRLCPADSVGGGDLFYHNGAVTTVHMCLHAQSVRTCALRGWGSLYASVQHVYKYKSIYIYIYKHIYIYIYVCVWITALWTSDLSFWVSASWAETLGIWPHVPHALWVSGADLHLGMQRQISFFHLWLPI